MTSRTHNAKAGKAQSGSSGDNPRREAVRREQPDHSNARDREGRKGGSREHEL